MKLARRIKEDIGATEAVAFIVIIAFVMVLLISFVDVGLYFNTKNQMQTAAENGARSVALYGGLNTEVRKIRGGSTSPEDLVLSSIPDNIRDSSMVKLNNIQCGPNKVEKAGERVHCDVNYTYKGLAGKFGLFQLGNTDVKVIGASVSEVGVK